MQLFMLAAVGALFAVWIVVGVRLLLLAQRSRGFPEFVLGLALLLQAGLGYPLSVAAPFTGAREPLVTGIAAAFSNAGCLLLYVFTAQVFHAGSRLAWAAVGAAAALLTVHAIGSALDLLAVVTPEQRLAAIHYWSAWILALSGGSWGWSGIESLRYHALLRRRVPLGLADPVVANRVLLWGLMGSTSLATVGIDTLLLYVGGPLAQQVLLPLVTALAGLLVSVFLALAFMPPRAYLAALRSRAQAPSA
jgi:hypothetical protein